MSNDLYTAINLGVEHNSKVFFDTNKVAIMVLACVFTPALMLVHLPVSLSILSASEHKDKAKLALFLFHMMSPAVTCIWLLKLSDIQWLMQAYPLRKIYIALLLADLKRNLVFFALWLTPPLLIYFSEQSFDALEYLMLLACCLALYVLSFAINLLVRYRALSSALTSLPVLFGGFKGYIWIMRPLGMLIIGLSINSAAAGIAWKIISVFFSALLIAHNIALEVRDERLVLFWKHCFNLSTPGLLLRAAVKDVGVAAILLLLVSALFNFEEITSKSLYLLVFIIVLYQLMRFSYGRILFPAMLMMLSYCLMFI